MTATKRAKTTNGVSRAQRARSTRTRDARPATTQRQTVSLALVQFAPRKGDVRANFERIEQVFAALRHDKEGF
ncbi:MAG: hypothetical protein JO194_03620, partial [Candidatus Eremiobacteraeota bacterium]|nr:hypothetical protein [Candidatus Eremiobacteraeota bacterium]